MERAHWLGFDPRQGYCQRGLPLCQRGMLPSSSIGFRHNSSRQRDQVAGGNTAAQSAVGGCFPLQPGICVGLRATGSADAGERSGERSLFLAPGKI